MDDKWQGSGYDPDRTWAEIQHKEWERKNPSRWYDDVLFGLITPILVLGSIALICLGLFYAFITIYRLL